MLIGPDVHSGWYDAAGGAAAAGDRLRREDRLARRGRTRSLNRLVGLDVRGDQPKVIASYPTVRQPDTVAVAPGARTLWVTGTKDGLVQRISR
jgi:hypothetical protein